MSFSYDWSRFTKRINIKAPVQKIYDVWATRIGLEYWFLREADFKKPSGEPVNNNAHIQEGDTYTWRWHGYDNSVSESGEILAANGADYLKFRFGNAGNVAVNISMHEGESIVELTQDEIPQDEKGKAHYHVGCGEGWTFYLANLKSMLEGGIDLRNKNERIQKVINS